MAIGAATFLGYDLIHEFMRHHDENNLRPAILDHLLAMSIIGTVGGLMATNSVKGAFGGFLYFGINFGFMSYWLMNFGGQRPGGALHAPVAFNYDNDVTKEEKERIEMLDQTAILAYNLQLQPGYGVANIYQKCERNI